MEQQKHFIDCNEGFTCIKCEKNVPEAPKTCRNHCTECLYSMHVDETVPGDRKSECGGLMKPIALEIVPRKYIITHECESCGIIKKNKAAIDDNSDSLTKLLKYTNEQHFKKHGRF